MAPLHWHGIELERRWVGSDGFTVKTLSVQEAQGHFVAVCEAARAGEVIRLQMADGSLLELTSVPATPGALPNEQLAACYEDPDWAAFENRCATASDAA